MQDLRAKDRLPAVHLVDTGFLDAELLVASRRQDQVELLGPTRQDRRWQARAGEGFGTEHFAVDFRRQKAVCPAGQESVAWVPRVDNRGNASIYIRFAAADCGPCPSRAKCTASRAEYPRRSIAVRPEPQHEALQERRELEESGEYAREYARRAGVEGTILNFVRVADWLAEARRAHTRPWRFATLMAHPC